MKGWGNLLVASVFVAACASAGPAPIATPSMPATATPTAAPTASPITTRPVDVPSGSCIFTLDVDNQSSGPIYVQINEVRVATLQPQTTKRFMDMIQGLPDMPWQVRLLRASDGAVLGEAHFTYNQLDGHMTARDQDVAQSVRQCVPA